MSKKILNFLKKNFNYYSPGENNLNSNILLNKDCEKLKQDNFNLREAFFEKVLEKFKSRRSIRKFSDQKVPWESVYKIIDAGMNAPVAGGIQNYKIIVVEDFKQRQELGKIAFQQYWISDAPYILIVIRDDYRLEQLYPSEGKIYSVQNSAALIENMLMMTHFLDLGSCWVEAYDNQVLREYLNIPIEYKIDALIPIGYPLEIPKVIKDPFDTHVFYNKFNQLTRKENN